MVKKKKKFSIGIDLGITNTCVAVVRDGTPEIIENDVGRRTTLISGSL